MNSALGNIKAIAKRELSAYFSSPVAYVFIFIFLIISPAFAFLFGAFFERDRASLESFFMWHPWFYLFLVPAVGMRLWAEERRVGTLELLLTMPITTWQAILGKFLACWAFLVLALALTFPIWVTVNYLGRPDNGVVICTYLGSALMAGTYLAIACMTSAMTRNQVVSFILSLVICLVLVLGGVPRVQEFFNASELNWLGNFAASLSVYTHFESIQRGVIDIRDLVYFFSIMVFSLFTTGVIIRSHRSG